MKKLVKIALAAALPFMVRAATETVDGVEWTYYVQDGGAVVGTEHWEPAVPRETSGDIAIPASLGGVPVVGLAGGAFEDCSELTGVSIPAGVTSVGAFAFRGCERLASVTLPDGLVDLGDVAFARCTALKDIRLPACVTNIGDSAFGGAGLESIDIPDSVLDIGYYAFSGCAHLKTVTIGSGVRSIRFSFEDCPSLASITVSPGNSFYSDIDGVLYDKARTRLERCPEAADSLLLPQGLREIGFSAAEGCSNLTSVVIPDSVTNISFSAFRDCTELRDVTIGSGVRLIRDFAFLYCDGLTSIVIPRNVTTLEYWAFGHCANLVDAVVPTRFRGVVNAECPVFEGCPDNLKITFKNVGDGSSSGGDVAIPDEWQKARTLRGVATRALPAPYGVQGVFELKCGKASKKGVAKVSATLTGMDGKKKSYRAQSVDVTGETVTVNFDGLAVTVGGDSFAGGDGLAGGLGVASADVGGALADGAHVFGLADFDLAVDGLQADLLPTSTTFDVVNGKWAFGKNASVKWARDRVTKEYALAVDTSKGKTNLSSLKLAYAAKAGQFKGSFKAYALEEANGRTRLKKYAVNVIGFVVDGAGFGRASCKKPVGGPWAATVE